MLLILRYGVVIFCREVDVATNTGPHKGRCWIHSTSIRALVTAVYSMLNLGSTHVNKTCAALERFRTKWRMRQCGDMIQKTATKIGGDIAPTAGETKPYQCRARIRHQQNWQGTSCEVSHTMLAIFRPKSTLLANMRQNRYIRQFQPICNGKYNKAVDERRHGIFVVGGERRVCWFKSLGSLL